MPCLTKLHSLFYPNGIKVIPHNIFEILTPVALAHLIMGDGEARTRGLVLCTNSYSIEDVFRLMNVLMIRYGLECKLLRQLLKKQNQFQYPKNGYMIYIRERSMPLLQTIVEPFFHPSMMYKIRSYSSSANITNSVTHKIGSQVQIKFTLTQHSNPPNKVSRETGRARDISLIGNIQKYLGCGSLFTESERSVVYLIVTKLSDIIIPFFDKYPIHGVKSADYADLCKVALLMKDNCHLTEEGLAQIIIPFFQKHALQGVKVLDYQDFCKVAELMETKTHLTQEGLDKITLIKNNMNRARIC
jgi:hypothetical protein